MLGGAESKVKNFRETREELLSTIPVRPLSSDDVKADYSEASIKDLPICDFEGAPDINRRDEYLVDAHRVLLLPNRDAGTLPNKTREKAKGNAPAFWALFARPGEIDKAGPESPLGFVQNPGRDDLLRAIQSNKGNFRYEDSGVLGSGHEEKQYKLCRSEHNDTLAGGPRVWIYKENKILDNWCEGNASLGKTPVDNLIQGGKEILTRQDWTRLVTEGFLGNTAQYCFPKAASLPTTLQVAKDLETFENAIDRIRRSPKFDEEVEVSVTFERKVETVVEGEETHSWYELYDNFVAWWNDETGEPEVRTEYVTEKRTQKMSKRHFIALSLLQASQRIRTDQRVKDQVTEAQLKAPERQEKMMDDMFWKNAFLFAAITLLHPSNYWMWKQNRKPKVTKFITDNTAHMKKHPPKLVRVPEVLEILRRAEIALNSERPHLFLVGRTGSGKDFIGKAIMNLFANEQLHIPETPIKGRKTGNINATGMAAAASKWKGMSAAVADAVADRLKSAKNSGLKLLSEASILLTIADSAGEGESGANAYELLLDLFDPDNTPDNKPKSGVIFTTSQWEKIKRMSPDTIRRMGDIIFIPDFSPDSLVTILDTIGSELLTKNGVTVATDPGVYEAIVHASRVNESSPNARVGTLLKQLAENARRRESQHPKITMHDVIQVALDDARSSGVKASPQTMGDAFHFFESHPSITAKQALYAVEALEYGLDPALAFEDPMTVGHHLAEGRKLAAQRTNGGSRGPQGPGGPHGGGGGSGGPHGGSGGGGTPVRAQGGLPPLPPQVQGGPQSPGMARSVLDFDEARTLSSERLAPKAETAKGPSSPAAIRAAKNSTKPTLLEKGLGAGIIGVLGGTKVLEHYGVLSPTQATLADLAVIAPTILRAPRILAEFGPMLPATIAGDKLSGAVLNAIGFGEETLTHKLGSLAGAIAGGEAFVYGMARGLNLTAREAYQEMGNLAAGHRWMQDTTVNFLKSGTRVFAQGARATASIATQVVRQARAQIPQAVAAARAAAPAIAAGVGAWATGAATAVAEGATAAAAAIGGSLLATGAVVTAAGLGTGYGIHKSGIGRYIGTEWLGEKAGEGAYAAADFIQKTLRGEEVEDLPMIAIADRRKIQKADKALATARPKNTDSVKKS